MVMVEAEVVAAWWAQRYAEGTDAMRDEEWGLPVPSARQVRQFRLAVATAVADMAARWPDVPITIGVDNNPDDIIGHALGAIGRAPVSMTMELPRKTHTRIDNGRVRVQARGIPEHEVPIRALVVLGGGLHPDGSMPPWVASRAAAAAQEWHDGVFGAVIASGGGLHPDRTEAAILAEALIQHDVPPEVIVPEKVSRSTAQNAWYTRQHLEALGVDEVVLVTNDFHLLRAQRLFSHILGHPVKGLAADVGATSAEVVALLAACDDPQDRYLTEVLLPRIPDGRLRLRGWQEFLFERSELAGTWQTFRDTHADYRAAWKRLTELMNTGPDAVRTGQA